MERIINQKHNKETFLYATSKMFERMGYFGLRALIILYMLSETLNLSRSDAFKIYGWAVFLVFITQIFGGFFGDLVVGNRKAIIIGGLIQAIGSFILCIPSINGLYIGLAFIGLGGGIYKPNLTSQFGKLYLNKTKLLDSGFLILNLSVNIGTFIGTLLIAYIGERFDWTYGFILAGVFYILSIIYPFFTKERKENVRNKTTYNLNNRILFISLAVVFVGLFWTIYEIPTFRIFELKIELKEFLNFEFLKNSKSSLITLLLIPISFLLILFWTKFYYSQVVKLIIGFALGLISFGMLLFIPEISIENQIFLYLLSLVVLGIAETHISPIVYSTITRYVNPKFLAIAIGLSTIPTRLMYILFMVFNNDIFNDSVFALKVSMIVMAIILIILIGLFIVLKKTTYNTV